MKMTVLINSHFFFCRKQTVIFFFCWLKTYIFLPTVFEFIFFFCWSQTFVLFFQWYENIRFFFSKECVLMWLVTSPSVHFRTKFLDIVPSAASIVHSENPSQSVKDGEISISDACKLSRGRPCGGFSL